MALVALIAVRRSRTRAADAPAEIHLGSPVSLGRVLTFAALFLAIQIVSTLGERYLGHVGFLGVSVLGGLVSSASTSAAAATVASHGQIRPALAGDAVVLASVASALVNLPIIYRAARNSAVSRSVTWWTIALATVGFAVLLAQHIAWPDLG
jgi:uncharacterized membrane protein (DUF4010 family)